MLDERDTRPHPGSRTVSRLRRVNLFLVPRTNLYHGLTEQTEQRKLIQLVTNFTHLGDNGFGLLGLRCGEKNWIWIPLNCVLSRT